MNENLQPIVKMLKVHLSETYPTLFYRDGYLYGLGEHSMYIIKADPAVFSEFGINTEKHESWLDIGVKTLSLVEMPSNYEIADDFYPNPEVLERARESEYFGIRLQTQDVNQFFAFMTGSGKFVDWKMHGKHIKNMLKLMPDCYACDKKVVLKKHLVVDEHIELDIMLTCSTMTEEGIDYFREGTVEI